MRNTQRKKVFVAMSGGVDSSVAAYLLKKRGYDVLGVFMRCFNLDGCTERDAEDARRVAEHIGIPFYVWDFEEEYKKRVLKYMIEGYRKGITPNPDVMCNREIKFGLFLKRALVMGADCVATGHYVKIKKSKIKNHPEQSRMDDGSKLKTDYKLFQAKDINKDQSYFLWTLTQDNLQHCLFPIGDYLKSEVRAIARRAGIPTAEKKDSQGICFLGQVKLGDFLKQYIHEKPGVVLTTSGEKIGKHSGAQFYTIGQRQGLNLGMKNKELRIKGKVTTTAHYVVSKDVQSNTIVVAEKNDVALYQKEIRLTNVNFISSVIHNSKFTIPVMARVRYRQPLAPAVLKKGNKERGTKLVFETPQKFVAPGQSAVWYSKSGAMLGGGVIVK